MTTQTAEATKPTTAAGPIPKALRRPVSTPEEEAANRKKQTAARAKARAKSKAKDKKIHAKGRKRSYVKQTGISKKHKVLQMIKGKGGATATQMIEETGWLPHTLRAQITRHRQAGHKITAKRKDGVTTYTIE